MLPRLRLRLTRALRCFQGPLIVLLCLISAPLLDDIRVPPKASFSASPTGALPFDPFTSVSRGSTSST